MQLPELFIQRMQTLLQDSAGDYLASFATPPVKALHLNTARMHPQRFLAWQKAHAELLPAEELAGSGIFLTTANGIGHHPLHHAGLIYSQDPAAQLVLAGVALSKDLRILDLCAAPGGKTSQLARAVDGGSGFVVANEPHPARNRILLGNIERMGYRNVCVTKAEPEDLAVLYPESFDLVVVDAPCSGEVMFRKYPESIQEWSMENVQHCAQRQKEILRSAVSCLRPGGRLIYSTCTYAPEEDEEQLQYLLHELCLQPDTVPAIVQDQAMPCAPSAFRCYPHLFPGEGQFMAYLKKPGDTLAAAVSQRKPPLAKCSKQEAAAFTELYGLPADAFPLYSLRGRIIVLPFALPRLSKKGLSCLGVTAAEWDEKKKRYQPHHQFFSAYGMELPQTLDLAPDDPALWQYLCGAELPAPDGFSKGYAAICCMGAALGGVRVAGGRMKNDYPKGLLELS